ncbi:protein unc-13-like [Citrus sinensis]|uniref:Protein unc-13-like n=1 Tax=Citrus sinensis TaxID=2711 RepID=A0ACB8KD74_CITSI|nr:protein unc-13-like [Citrus sinensis]
MPPGAITLDDVDLDQVSVDYVLGCAKKGGMLELSEAIRDFHDHTDLPQMNNGGSADEFFLVTNPQSSGSPPRRAPPPITVLTPPPVPVTVPPPAFAPSPIVSAASRSESFNSTQERELTVDDIEDFEDDDDIEEINSHQVSRRRLNDASDLVVKLPSFTTGITDDDLRETAYEVLLACAGAAGGLIVPSKEKRKDKKSRLMKKLGRSKNDNVVNQSQRAPGLVGLLETMRVQMEISEAMDIRTRQGLLNALTGKVGKRMDTLLIPLELLCCISRTEFSDKKSYIRWQKRQLNMLEEGLINHPVVGFGESGRRVNELSILLAKIEESESLPSSTGELQRTECLRSLREIAIPLAERPARGDLTGEVCHWADGYHLNVRLYEKLLLSVFDVLDEGKLTEEVEEILELLKSTWRVLGITETMHYTCYAWVLFRQCPVMMENVVSVAMLARRLLLEEPEMILQVVDKSEIHEHPLALLAEETKKLLKRDSSIFMPILSKRHPQATIVSASLLHKLYGNKLKPFSDGAEHLTEDVASVFPAADSLEQYIISLITSTCEEETAAVYCRKLMPYQIESISGTLVLRWINSQLGRILSWVERAIQQERWDPISPQQRHASSIVEVYRIVEETVDQFFALQVPMRSTELNALFRGIDNAFQVYANHVTDKLGSKEDLVPPEPVLTRYRKEAGIKAFVKKEILDPRMSEERRSSEINILTTAALCVQLNTLHYAISQLNKLEDSILERWTRKKPHENFLKKLVEEKSKSFTKNDTFDGSRKDINAAIDRICEFTGTKIIFWDLREPFIDNLYKPSVSKSRLESLIEPLDVELSKLCDVIVEPLRDRVVTGLLQASLDGLLRVLLNGGPFRVFFPSDAKQLEEDLEILKEFFISGGDGLPRGVVENQVARARHVVKLHGYELRVFAMLINNHLQTRELIDDLRSGSSQDMLGTRGKLGADSETLLRILCHRSDSEASHFLKKQYKIPKSSS